MSKAAKAKINHSAGAACSICRRILNQQSDLSTQSMGMQCIKCMSELGDAEAKRAMRKVLRLSQPVLPMRVYTTDNRHSTIVVQVTEHVVHHIPYGEEIVVRRSHLATFQEDYSLTEYPVGLAAFRFINPVLGASFPIGQSARTILEIIMKTFLINVKTGKYVGTFADAAAAVAAQAGNANVVAVSTAKQLAELSAKDLSAISAICGTKTKVTDADKAKAAADVFAALKKLGNAPVSSTKDRAKNEDSKMEKAFALFEKMYGKSSRGDIIAKFRDEVKLTEGGAPTYFYLCVKRMTAEYKAAGKKMPEAVATVRATKPKADKAAKKPAAKPADKKDAAKKPAAKAAAKKPTPAAKKPTPAAKKPAPAAKKPAAKKPEPAGDGEPVGKPNGPE